MRAREYIDTPDMGCWIEPNGNVHECDHRSTDDLDDYTLLKIKTDPKTWEPFY